MFNGNKFMPMEEEQNLINKKLIENKRNENYHYLHNQKRDLSYDINYRKNKRIVNDLNNKRANSHKKEMQKDFPKYLNNIDLNKLAIRNENIDENNNIILSKSTNKKEDITSQKYLEDILSGNDNNIITSLKSSGPNNLSLSNTFKSSREFDILKNTIFNDTTNTNMNKLSKSLNFKISNKDLNSIDNDIDIDKGKIVNHDDIPIIVRNVNFMDLVERELANENINNLKYSIKSFDNLRKNKCPNSINSINENKIILNKLETYDKDDSDIKEKFDLLKIIKDTKNAINKTRSKTPDNSMLKRKNQRKIFKNNNNKINFNENIPNINFDIKQNKNIKDNICNNIIHNNTNNYVNPFHQKKIKNIINNNSITIISHFDIEEKSIKRNSDLNYNDENNFENKELNDSTDKDITNYIGDEEDKYIDKENEKRNMIQKKINELNYEINKCKVERNNFNKAKIHYEKLKSKLISDIEIFNKQKAEFKNYIANELEKVKLKQQKYTINNKLMKNLKNENEILKKKFQESKEIIESLKHQILEIQNKNKSLSKNNNNNISSLRQSFTKINNINKNDNHSTRELSYRNRASLKSIKYNNKANKDLDNDKALNTFMTDNDLYSINVNIKNDNDNDSFERNNSKSNEKKNLNNDAKKNYNFKTYEVDIHQRKRTPININKDIHSTKNENNNNIITKEKYKNILKLINNSLKKNNGNKGDKSFIEKVKDADLNTLDNKKKLFFKCKSNINLNKKNNHSNYQNSLKRTPSKLNEKNTNIDIIKDNKLSLKEYDFKIPEKYKNHNYKLIKTLKADDKIINIYDNNKKEIIFPSGVRKEIFKDGYQIVYFINGDIKQNYPNEKSIYYFKQAKTVQTTFKNGILVVKFENNQIERHYPNGKKQILYPDGTEKTIFKNGKDINYDKKQ